MFTKDMTPGCDEADALTFATGLIHMATPSVCQAPNHSRGALVGPNEKGGQLQNHVCSC